MSKAKPAPAAPSKKTIRIRCQGAGLMSYKDITAFQGELKSLSKDNYARLKKLVTDNGMTSPIHVWKHKGKFYNLDGHQRCRLFGELESKEGYTIPKVPVVYIEADSIKQAKKILLSNVSQFGKVERQGLYEFALEADLAPAEMAENFHFPEVNLPSWMEEFFLDPTKDSGNVAAMGDAGASDPDSLDRSASDHVRQVQLFFDSKTHPEFQQKTHDLGKHYGKDNLTDTVMEAVREAHRALKPHK